MESTFYRATVAIFLDVLGTKDRTLFEEKYKVHRLFHEEIERNKRRQEASPHVVYRRYLRSFSDCAFILYHYRDELEQSRMDDFNLLYIALFNTSLSVLRILHAGFLVRGGVSFGQGFIDELGFFGPVIEEAYLLESQKAVFPRIILERTIGKNLTLWEESREPHEIIKKLFPEMPRLVLQDSDGEYYLNTFFELEKSSSVEYLDGRFMLSDVKVAVLNRIAVEESRHSDDVKILDKLRWMRNCANRAQLKMSPDASSSFTSIVFEP